MAVGSKFSCRKPAVKKLREAADEEKMGLEKLLVTLGPTFRHASSLEICSLTLNRPCDASKEYRAASVAAPRRRGALAGAARQPTLSATPRWRARCGRPLRNSAEQAASERYLNPLLGRRRHSI